ncbi:MAG: MarR family transcriptional regulator [Chloroflexi bacterium]|nr:MarR family transcriptional regulator [Chloroflexota bacterium]
MAEIFQDKGSATRFQILVEIAASGPGVQQRRIAAKLGITPQAVSGHVRRLLVEGLIVSAGRSSYRVSTEGVNWMLKMLRELQGYVSVVQQAVTNITVCAAIANSDIDQGQQVGLRMKNGLLYATVHHRDGNARGIAVSSAKHGEDVGVSNIEGLVELTRGKVTVLQIPGIQKGGSRQVDLKRLRTCAGKRQPVGVIGIEALAALRRAGMEPQYFYGVVAAVTESARCGLSFTVVCTDDAIVDLLKKLEEEKLDYELIDLARTAV